MEETGWGKARLVSFEEMLFKLVTSSILRAHVSHVWRAAGSYKFGIYHGGGFSEIAWKIHPRIRSHPGSSHVLFNRPRDFSAWRAFLICLVPSVCIPAFLSVFMTHPLTFERALHTTLPGSPVPAYSSNVGSLDGSSPDLDGRSSTLEDKFNEILSRLAQLLALTQSVSTFDSHVQTLTNALGVLTTRIAGN